MGLFHPHADKHNIKKENIGLIEVMGLAVLPSRLKSELERLGQALVKGEEIASVPAIAAHAEWVMSFAENYTFTEDNVTDILRREVGRTFEAVLEDAGVYKCTPEGREAFLRFVSTL